MSKLHSKLSTAKLVAWTKTNCTIEEIDLAFHQLLHTYYLIEICMFHPDCVLINAKA